MRISDWSSDVCSSDLGPGVSVGDRVEIRSFCHLEGAEVGDDVVLGLFARLRPGARIGRAAHVGNFVEIKNAELGEGAKANHLTYLGDATVGAAANVGAGTITCKIGRASCRERVCQYV